MVFKCLQHGIINFFNFLCCYFKFIPIFATVNNTTVHHTKDEKIELQY